MDGLGDRLRALREQRGLSMSELARRVFCRTTQRVAMVSAARKRGRAVNAESWSRLDDFAHRTFAPASEASRISGAGAGLEDNE